MDLHIWLVHCWILCCSAYQLQSLLSTLVSSLGQLIRFVGLENDSRGIVLSGSMAGTCIYPSKNKSSDIIHRMNFLHQAALLFVKDDAVKTLSRLYTRTLRRIGSRSVTRMHNCLCCYILH